MTSVKKVTPGTPCKVGLIVTALWLMLFLVYVYRTEPMLKPRQLEGNRDLDETSLQQYSILETSKKDKLVVIEREIVQAVDSKSENSVGENISPFNDFLKPRLIDIRSASDSSITESKYQSIAKSLAIKSNFALNTFSYNPINLQGNFKMFRENWLKLYRKNLAMFLQHTHFVQSLGMIFNKNRDAEFPFTFVIRNDKFCDGKSNLTIIDFLFSKPNDFEVRKVIRSLWGNQRWSKITGLYVVHILGMAASAEDNKLIQRENEMFNDIIQVNFKDSYHNLTLKTLSMLHWAHHFCKSAPWILKSDTDAFVNSFELVRLLKPKEVEGSDTDVYNMFCLEVRGQSHVIRPEDNREMFNKEKWAVSYEEYPFNRYPPYCQGTSYVLSNDLAWEIYQYADKLNPFRLEDVYFTGIIPAIMDVKVAYWDAKKSKNNPFQSLRSNEVLWKKVLQKELYENSSKL